MDKRDVAFAVLFIITIQLNFFFLGPSFPTGMVIESMSCDGGVCYETCNMDSDCTMDEVCCAHNGYGICKSYEACDLAYSFLEADEKAIVAKTTRASKADTYLFSGVIVLAVIIGLVYMFAKITLNNTKGVSTKSKKTVAKPKKVAKKSVAKPKTSAKKTVSKKVTKAKKAPVKKVSSKKTKAKKK